MMPTGHAMRKHCSARAPRLGKASFEELVASKSHRIISSNLLYSKKSAYLRRFGRADERTRTADLLITVDNSRIAGLCTGLQIPHI